VRAFMEQIECPEACLSLQEMNAPGLVARLCAALDGAIAPPQKLAEMHRRQRERAVERGRLLRRAIGM